MTRSLPTLRGWVALTLPLLAGLVLLAILPARFIESGVGTWILQPVEPSTWILSALMVFLCVAACLEALRRGSRIDKILLVVAIPLTYWLINEVLSFTLLRVRPTPI
jgi:hypothetical protein